MPYITSDAGVAIIDQPSGDEVLAVQRVGDIVYLDVHTDIPDAKDGRNPVSSLQIKAEDLAQVCSELVIV